MSWDTSKKELVAIGLSAIITTAGAAESQPTITPKDLIDHHNRNYQQVNDDGFWDNANRISDIDNQNQEDIIAIGDIVNRAKVVLGLPDKDIAEIFQVSRQTIHTYRTQEASSINLNENTRHRSHELFATINKIKDIFERSPGPAAKNIKVNQVTLFELLCKNELDADLVVKTSSALRDKIQKDRQLSHAKRDSDVERKRTLHSLTKNT